MTGPVPKSTSVEISKTRQVVKYGKYFFPENFKSRSSTDKIITTIYSAGAQTARTPDYNGTYYDEVNTCCTIQ